jgi:hypothetical protein
MIQYSSQHSDSLFRSLVIFLTFFSPGGYTLFYTSPVTASRNFKSHPPSIWPPCYIFRNEVLCRSRPARLYCQSRHARRRCDAQHHARAQQACELPHPLFQGLGYLLVGQEHLGYFRRRLQELRQRCKLHRTGGDSDAVFILKDGATLKNAIVGKDQIEGVHCEGSCTIENVWWSAVCEDALSLKGDGDATVTGGQVSARQASLCRGCDVQTRNSVDNSTRPGNIEVPLAQMTRSSSTTVLVL